MGLLGCSSCMGSLAYPPAGECSNPSHLEPPRPFRDEQVYVFELALCERLGLNPDEVVRGIHWTIEAVP